MALTDVQICNLALGHIGHTKFISALTDRTNEAQVLNTFYEPARDVVLEDYPWPFATKYETLGLVTDFTDETDPHDWDYAYRYPSDCVYARRIVTSNGRSEPKPAPFKVGSDEDGRLIYTNEEDAILEYTRLVDDPSLYPSKFAMALSWYLASLIAPGLAKSDKKAGACAQMYHIVKTMAEAGAGNEQHAVPEPESEFIRARE